jgi:K+-sensing histidine kinase KdpD
MELILDNALKYSSDRGEVSIKIFQDDSLVGIEVTDSGPGFSTKAMESLYDLFAADNLRYHSHGFGVGLATAKLILDTFSAKLEINNLPDKGAMVRIIFDNSPALADSSN